MSFENASRIIKILNKAGYEAYIVGGCVRDTILKKTPDDWDITTSAKPEQVKKLFRRTVDTGIMHGTVTVMLPNKDTGSLEGYEVTTYRIDGSYEDHRRPASVEFTASLSEDLKRRDFTINAMAYNGEEGLIDLFDGEGDLNRGIIRCVGNAEERFNEDALRMLRAIRFAGQLNFKIEENTRAAIKKNAQLLTGISAERIQTELTKLLMSDHPELLREAYLLGVTAVVFPEFDAMMETEQNSPHHMYSVGEHTIKVIENVPADKTLRYAALLHDIAKPDTKTTDGEGHDHFYGHPAKGAEMARTVMRRLKLDNRTTDDVCRLVKYHDYGISQEVGIKAFRRFLGELGKGNFRAYIALRRADTLGQSGYKREDKLKAIEKMEAMYAEVLERKECISISELKVDGRALIDAGMKPGREIGIMLKELLELVIDDPARNTREELLLIVKDRLNSK